jgi:stage II sporulation protein AA (anti-sigma F factor antagonist)
MNQTATVQSRHANDVVVIDVNGDVTAAAETMLLNGYEAASEQKTGKILLTFTREGYINSAGIAIIIEITTRCRNRNETLRIVQPSKHFQKIFDMIGLTQYVDVYESEQDGLTGF